MPDPDVIIVGGGLSGLCCGLELSLKGISFIILESSDDVGGRVRTDLVDGYQLDRGLQVLLTAYPEAKRILDYGQLNLKPFYPGAMIHSGGRFHLVADPFRHPIDAASGAFSPVGSLSDKLRIARLRSSVCSGTLEDLFKRPEMTTREKLSKLGFGSKIIQTFFKPFLTGVYFDPDLEVSSRMFEFGFRMFFSGDTSLPEKGMGAIPKQIASRLPAGSIRLNSRVLSIENEKVILESSESLNCKAVVVATHEPETARLANGPQPRGFRSSTCLHYAADTPPIQEPILVMNGATKGIVNNLIVPTNVHPSYAPKGKALITVNVTGNPESDDDRLESSVRGGLREFFGPMVREWKALKIDRIKYSLPLQTAPTTTKPWESIEVRPGLFCCGEYLSVDSMQWAMASGRNAGESVSKFLGRVVTRQNQ